MSTAGTVHRYRTIWISDLHLGTPWSKTAFLIDFLERTEAEHLYLVGDVIDGWSLTRSWFWRPGKDRVLQAILRKAAEGTRVVYVPGNHDEAFRPYAGTVVSGVVVARDAVHVTADGRRLLVIHGDAFDEVIQCARWLAVVGDRLYQAALRANDVFNAGRRLLGMSYWSISAWAKLRVKRAVSYICAFEEAAAAEARRRGLDGVVCGHIHTPEIRTIDGILYANDGDWVESCTALVEHMDGTLAIVEWTAPGAHPAPPSRARAAVPAAVTASGPFTLPAFVPRPASLRSGQHSRARRRTTAWHTRAGERPACSSARRSGRDRGAGPCCASGASVPRHHNVTPACQHVRRELDCRPERFDEWDTATAAAAQGAAQEAAGGSANGATAGPAHGATRAMSGRRVLVVDDEPDLVACIRHELLKCAFDVTTAGTGLEAVERVRRERPDVVLLDRLLPDLDGAEVFRRLRSDPRTRSVRVLMITALGAETDAVGAFALGVDDYVRKPFGLKELVARIEAVLRRGALPEDPDLLLRGPLEIHVGRHVAAVRGHALPLTATEFRLLHALAARPGRVWRRSELLDRAVGDATAVLDRNIDVHVLGLRKKLGPERDLIRTIRGVGYAFRGDDDPAVG